MAKAKTTNAERIAALEKRAKEIQEKAKQLKAQERVRRDKAPIARWSSVVPSSTRSNGGC